MQSSEARTSARGVIQQIEGQAAGLGLPDLRGLVGRLQARVQQQQQH